MKIKLKFNKEDVVIIFLCYVSIMYQESIYMFKTYKYYEYMRLINYLLLILSFFLVSKQTNKTILNSILILILSSLPYVDVPKKSEILSILIRCYFIFILLSVKNKMKLYTIFYDILSYICFLSLIQYIMYYLGVDIKFEKLIPTNIEKAKEGIIYLKSNFLVFIFDGNNILKRFQAIFEEPGTLGTMIGMLLLFDENYTINKYKRIILIVSGILSQSTAFFLLYLLKLLKGIFFKNNRKVSIYILLFLFISSQSFYFINEKLYKRNYQKIFLVFEKNNREDNRSKIILNNFIKSKDIVLGTGNQMYEDYKNINISSWRLVVYYNGLVGVISLFIFILIISRFYSLKLQVKLAVLIFFCSFYQRPKIVTLANILILVSGSYYYNLFLIEKNKLSIKERN